MKPAPRRWEFAPTPGGAPSNNARATADLSPPTRRSAAAELLDRVLSARGFEAADAAALVAGAEERHDPFLLAGMPEAVITVGLAAHLRRPIAVYGDYDADGVAACALLTTALRAAGQEVLPYIPNRMTEGYGLHLPALEELAARGVGCVITVDCGTSSVDVAAARPPGMALVITDHHLAPAPGGAAPRLPDVEALVNPKRPDCGYPFDGLAGAGVALKLLEALEVEGIVPHGSAAAALPLAALGTVADMMPLRGENRSIVRRGLAALGEAPPAGLRALMDAAGVRGAPRASDLAFSLAPRVNAAGRMEDAEVALRLCLAASVEEAAPLAGRLHRQNAARQEAVARALAEAEERVAELDEELPAIVLGDPGWPMGIVGLVAGRIAERYARPTFIACLEGEEAKGSARSVRGVHLVQALDRAAQPLLRYGGHAAAAGFSLPPERFAEFAALVSAAVAAQLGGAPRERVFRIDAEVTLSQLDAEVVSALATMEPCGQGNPEALLAVHDCVVLGTSGFGAQGQHLRVLLGDGGDDASPLEAVAFNKPGLTRHLPVGRRVDACFAVDVDRWNGQERVRLRLRDVRPSRVGPDAAPAAENSAGSSRLPAARLPAVALSPA